MAEREMCSTCYQNAQSDIPCTNCARQSRSICISAHSATVDNLDEEGDRVCAHLHESPSAEEQANQPAGAEEGVNLPEIAGEEANEPLVGAREVNRPLVGAREVNRPLAGAREVNRPPLQINRMDDADFVESCLVLMRKCARAGVITADQINSVFSTAEAAAQYGMQGPIDEQEPESEAVHFNQVLDDLRNRVATLENQEERDNRPAPEPDQEVNLPAPEIAMPILQPSLSNGPEDEEEEEEEMEAQPAQSTATNLPHANAVNRGEAAPNGIALRADEPPRYEEQEDEQEARARNLEALCSLATDRQEGNLDAEVGIPQPRVISDRQLNDLDEHIGNSSLTHMRAQAEIRRLRQGHWSSTANAAIWVIRRPTP